MRERLHNAREKAHKTVRESPRMVIILSLVLLLLTATVAAASIEGTWSNNFEDGDANEWGGGAPFSVVQDSTEGNYSLEVPDGHDRGDRAEWEKGPTLDLTEEFLIEGTVRSTRQSDTSTRYPRRLGMFTGFGEGVLLQFDYINGNGYTYLATDINETVSDPEVDPIQRDFAGIWVNFKIKSAGDGTVKAKVWNVSESEPSSWQLNRSFNQQSAYFAMEPGSADQGRTMNLDSVTIEGTRASDPDLNLQTQRLFYPGETHPYEVYELRNESGTNHRYYVGDNTSVESLNTSLLTVDEQNQTLTAVNDSDVANTVYVKATYNNSTTYKQITVAKPTIENLAILPGIWRFVAVLKDSFLFALLIATFLAVPATRFSSAFGGLAVIEMVLVIGWFGGYVPLSMALVSIFVALFIGLNLAANIDYQAGSLRS